ncbi:MAG: GGDEF domain-containing protein [Acidobacteria bacterium]|nr:GGDEF domain-containing protein [Acidobacteriota bacterium]
MLTRLPANIEAVNRQIERFSGLRFQWPAFPIALEERFERDTAERRSRRLWLEGLIAIALFDLFLVADYFSSPQDFRRALIVRLLVVTPVCLIVNASMLQKPGKTVREASIAFASCLAGAAQLYLEANKSAAASAYVQMAVLAVVLFTNIVMRLRFPYAVATSIAMLAGDWVFLRVDHTLTSQEEILGMALAIATTAITLVANYSAGREERLNYLLNLRDELMVEDLNRLNAQLLRRSESDALTGLANRHSFDSQYAELWKRAVTSGTALSAIVVDVDHFKMLNDRYGHLYGDEVLRRIGSLLQQALRAKDDFAARFGGEEFVVLLPGTHLLAAAQVAARVCKMVELAGFPALDSSQKPYDSSTVATVSCGVATAYPTMRDRADDLLEAADRAMYQAKANGRNCVACADVKEIVRVAGY